MTCCSTTCSTYKRTQFCEYMCFLTLFSHRSPTYFFFSLEFSWNISWFWCTSTIYLCGSQSINNLCYLYSYNTFESDDGIPSPGTHCNIFLNCSSQGLMNYTKKKFLTFQVRDECQIWDTQSVHMLKRSQIDSTSTAKSWNIPKKF